MSRRASTARSVACLLGLGLVLAAPTTAVSTELRAGYGRAPLPAPDGGPLAGYGGLFDRNAEGVADPPKRGR